MKLSLQLNMFHSARIGDEMQRARSSLDDFEHAFRQIKEATGVSDVNEVIQKIISQEDTQGNLHELAQENAAKIEALNQEKQRIKERVEELKYSVLPNGRSGARKAIDELEKEHAAATAHLERTKIKCERLRRTLIDGKVRGAGGTRRTRCACRSG